MGFKESLQEALLVEEEVSNLLRRFGFEVFSNDDKKTNKFYDFSAHSETLSFTSEVKFDKKATETKRLAIEVFNARLNRPSGLMATHADCWIQVLDKPREIWIAKTSDLRLWVDQNLKHASTFRYGGDKNAYLLCFYKDMILPSVFMRLDTIALRFGMDFINNWFLKENNVRSTDGITDTPGLDSIAA